MTDETMQNKTDTFEFSNDLTPKGESQKKHSVSINRIGKLTEYAGQILHQIHTECRERPDEVIFVVNVIKGATELWKR